MQNQDQDHEPQGDFSQEGNNQNTSSNVLDPQTLENLAAFFSREPDEQQVSEEIIKDQQKKTNNHTTGRSRIENSSQSKSQSQSDSRSQSSSASRSRSREKSQPRWIYCCSKCKKNKKREKCCLCIVPASQRRIPLNKDGCSSCKCQGCSKEDVQLEYERKKAEEAEHKSHLELMRNGCCKECMKAFSGSGKACICQVPASVRRRKLPDSGCIYCGCFGCNPEDTHKVTETRKRSPTPEKLKYSHRVPRIKAKRSDDSFSRSRSRSNSYDSPPLQREQEEQLNNLDNSYIGNFLRKTFNIYPPLMGFGIPQRTYSYIHGKPQPR